MQHLEFSCGPTQQSNCHEAAHLEKMHIRGSGEHFLQLLGYSRNFDTCFVPMWVLGRGIPNWNAS